MMARLYSTDEQARAAAAAFVAAGYSRDDIAVLASQTTQAVASVTSAEAVGEGATSAALETSPSADEMTHAIRAGGMLGARADFYISQLTDGRSLVVATPPFIASRRAEEILDEHDPLPISHLPPRKVFVPINEQASPFSNMLGLPTLTDGPVLSNLLGLGTSQTGLSHFSRWLKPLSSDFRFSSVLGMSLLTTKATPLSSKTNMQIKSDRVAGKTSSFGMAFSTQRSVPFSSLLGLPLLSERKHFLIFG
ncbi:MAG: hypothetical protein AB8B57_10945 [Congregibacter sp.]